MPPKFRAIKELDGFDKTVAPRWLMIGTGAEKSALLHGGADLSVSVRDSAIAEIVGDASESSVSGERVLTIKGVKAGTTFLDAKNGNAVVARLEVCVKNRREVRVSFHFVQDKNGLGTRRNPWELLPIINFINEQVFLPQANVFVRLEKVNPALVINRRLGRVIRDTSSFPQIPRSEHEVDLIMSHGDKMADINVFFVIDYEDDKNPNLNQTAGTQYAKGIFIDDHFKHPKASIQNVLAHEIAHYLGVRNENHYYYKKNIDTLMYYRSRGGFRIPKYHVNLINP